VVYASFRNGRPFSEQEQRLISFIILKTISLATHSPLVELADSTNVRTKKRQLASLRACGMIRGRARL